MLILTAGLKENVFLSGRNLPNVHVMPYSDVSTYHLLWSDVVLVEAEALGEKLDAVAEVEHHADRRRRAAKAAKNVAGSEGRQRRRRRSPPRRPRPKAKKAAKVEAEGREEGRQEGKAAANEGRPRRSAGRTEAKKGK